MITLISLITPITHSSYNANNRNRLRARGGAEQFQWTTHPWLLHQVFLNSRASSTRADSAVQSTKNKVGVQRWEIAEIWRGGLGRGLGTGEQWE
jgi:hypothetical protein